MEEEKMNNIRFNRLEYLRGIMWSAIWDYLRCLFKREKRLYSND